MIKSDGDDAIRPGQGATINNSGTIRTDGLAADKADGIDFKGATFGTVNNTDSGTISGARHGVTLGGNNGAGSVTVTNAAGATITGRSGSGVGSDAGGTVTNYGTIEGAYSGSGDGDGDGVDIDYAGTITNYGTIKGTGAGGYDKGGRANNSEGISLGGGTITNSGTISGAKYGIVVNNDSNPDNSRSGVAATTITNEVGGTIEGKDGYAIRLENKLGTAADNDTIVNKGTIIGNGTIPDPTAVVTLQSGSVDGGSVGTLDGVRYTGTGSARFIRGDGAAIQMGEGDDVLTNYGTITGNTRRAISLEGGNDTLNLFTGSTITGRIDGGAGADTLNLGKAVTGTGAGTLANVIHFEVLNVKGGTWKLLDDQAYANGATIAAGATLQVGDGATAGSLAADVANAGALIFNRTDTSSYAGAISGSGSLTKAGTGTLTLTGASTYTGATTISEGTLTIQSATALGAADGTAATGTTVASGATLALKGGIAVGNEALSLTGYGLNACGALCNVSGINSYAGTITLTGTTRIGADAGRLTLSGPIAGAPGAGVELDLGGAGDGIVAGDIGNVGTVIKVGAGTWTLTGKSSLSDLLYAFGGALRLEGGGTVASDRGIVGGDTATTASATVTGSGSTWTNRSTLVVGDINGTGILTVAAGGAVSIGTNGAGTMTLAKGSRSTGMLNIGAAAGETAVAAGTVTAGEVAFGAGTGTITFNHTGNPDGSAVTFAPKITGVGSLNHLAGTTILSGASTYSGTTTIAGGTLRVANATALGAADGTAANGTTVASGATLALQGGIAVGNEALSLAGTGVGDGGALRNVSGDNSYAGAITLTDNSRIAADADRLTLSGSLAASGGGWVLTLGGVGDGRITGTIGNTIGSLLKDGTGTWTVTGQATLANEVQSSGGTLTIAEGGRLSNSDGFVGHDTGSSGTMTVTGTGSTWTNRAGLVVGFGGTGTLAIQGGGQVSNRNGTIGYFATSSGTVTVTGTGSTWTNKNSLSVGHGGTGTLAVQAGGQVSDTSGVLGNFTGSSGTATVSGTGSAWTNSSNLYVGNSGTGTLAIQGGGRVSANHSVLAADPHSFGTATVSGTGSTWTNSGDLYVGAVGTGTLVVQAGGQVSNGYGYLGYFSGSSGAATVAGAGSTWTNTGVLSVGHGGTGTLTVADGGLVSAGANGTGTVSVASLSGSTGTLAIGAVAGRKAVAAGTVQASKVAFGAGTGTITFNHTGNPDGTAVAFVPTITGTGTVSHLAGTTILTGANSYTGATTVSGGRLSAANATALGASAAKVTAGGTLDVNGVTIANVLILAGSGAGGAGALTGTGAAGVSGAITLAADAALGGSGTLTLSGGIGDGGHGYGLTKLGTGTAILTGTSTYTGATTLQDGTLRAGAAGAFAPVSAVTVASGATLDLAGFNQGIGSLAGTGRVSLGAGTLTAGADNSSTAFSGTITGSGGLAKAGTGTLTLSGLNTYTGPTTIAGGTLALTGAGSVAASSGVALAGGATFDIGGLTAGTAIASLTDTAPGQAGTVALGANTLTLTRAAGSYGGAILGTGGLTLAGGTQILAGHARHTGATTLESGTLRAGAARAFAPASAVTVASGATLDLAGFDQGIGSLAGAGRVSLGAGTLTAGADNSSTAFSGTIAGSGGLAKAGTGTLTLSGSNSYSGGTALLGGTLAVAADASLGASAGGLRFDGGTLVTTASLAMARPVTLAGDARLRPASGTSLTLNGSVTGPGGLVQDGEGTTILAGRNTYAGATTVAGGTLQIDGVLSASEVTVRHGGTLAGSSKIGDPLIEAGGRLAPGSAAAIGTLSIHGPLTFAAGSFYTVKLTPAANDRTDVTGPVALQGGTVQVLAGAGTYTPALRYTLLTATDGVTGRFSALQTTSNLAFLTPSLNYDAHSVSLGFAQTAPITSVVTTPNQTGPAAALNGVGPTVTSTAQPSATAQSASTAQPSATAQSASTAQPSATAQSASASPAAPTVTQASTVHTSVAVDGTTTTTISNSGGTTVVVASPAAQVATAVLNQTAPGAAQALTAISGEAHAADIGVVAQSAAIVEATLLDHLRFGMAPLGEAAGLWSETGLAGRIPAGTTVPAAYAAALPGEPAIGLVPVAPARANYALWGQALGAFGSTRGNGNAARLTRDMGGFVLGAETGFGALSLPGLTDLRVGVAAGYSVAGFDIPARRSSGQVESAFGAIYGRASLGAVELRGGAVYGSEAFDTRRQVQFPGFSQAVTGKAGGDTLQAFGEAGYRIAYGPGVLEPFVGGTTLHVRRDGFAERGGAAALRVSGHHDAVQTATAGVQGEIGLADLLGLDVPVLARGLVGYRRAFGDVVPRALVAFAGGRAFQTAGVPLARDAVVASAGIEARVATGLTLGLAYTGQVGERAQDHAMRGSLNLRW
ncbi:autotransporter-associated beta strand repeat-containing protein [Methylobacterium brachiatum]|uniref:autotransporter-associated beta strand repeat-containing protein n=1 Tax=Methylobacterium brachiatum TaxID=269660 RepID=UPI001113B232|nr:autotransporter-associated beta strand repeat-containing protein [Methylobacterium brachiatum]